MNETIRELKTYALDVLGCKVNRYDSRQIARLLEGFGLRAAKRGETADLVVVHTCGVTATAVQKSRQAVHRLIRKHPGATVFLTGCAASAELMDEPDVDVSVAAGPGWVQLLTDALQQYSLPNPDFRLPECADDLPAETFGEQTRGFLKIQDGCDANCAYCIVPQLRKEPRDKPIDAVVSEAEELVRRGCHEVVVAGVHVGLYGRGTHISLYDILTRLIEIPDLGRIRMSSLHPAELTDELLSVWASSKKVMPHLHLSLQSGSDGVLRRMGRGYTAGEYAAAVIRARAVLDHPAVTTDVITGFPGETEAEFEETVDFCRRIGFADMHIFPFSPRPGTRAAEMPDQVPVSIAHERQHRLAALAGEMKLAFNRTFVGRTVEVLVERCVKCECSGVSEHYVPVRFPGGPERYRTVVEVQAVSADAAGLSGQMA
ncbi:MAG: tRNA (N(6)-L-threonylcarbamoyladenosine(37)-C(2))-methylthiotransferase MtaB [Kiritimatiellales bacterium]